MKRCPKINFHLSMMSKWLAKPISTKDSFKITTRKRHVYIDIGLTLKRNQCFYLGIWNNDRTKMRVLPYFQVATRLNSQKQMKLSLLMNSYSLIFMNIRISNSHKEVSTTRKCCFWLYFSSLHDYWPTSTWNSLVHTSWCEMERCEKRAFQLLKMRKKVISWNIKTKCVIEFLLTGLQVCRIILDITRWAHKRQTFT